VPAAAQVERREPPDNCRFSNRREYVIRFLVASFQQFKGVAAQTNNPLPSNEPNIPPQV
jgi:hypothetical protein